MWHLPREFLLAGNLGLVEVRDRRLHVAFAARLLRDAPQGKFSTNILWNRAIEEDRLFGVAFTGMWYEVGTPQHIKPTEEALTGG